MKRITRINVQIATSTIEIIQHDDFGPLFGSSVRWIYGMWVNWAQDQMPSGGGAATPLNVSMERDEVAWSVPGVNLHGQQVAPCIPIWIPICDTRFPRVNLWESVGSDGTVLLTLEWDDKQPEEGKP